MALYGILISLGALLAFFIGEKAVKKRNLPLTTYYHAVNGALIGGLVGGRLYHILDYWSLYSRNPLLILQVWKGGMGIFGALFGGVIGIGLILFLAAKKKCEETLTSGFLLKWLDIFALGVPLIQAIGRWGNFFNHELYGKETNLSWGLAFEGKRYHPLFLYESIANFALFLILLEIERSWSPENPTKQDNQTATTFKSGTIFFTYLTGYGLIRFFLEFLRLRSWTLHGINVAQTISLLFILTGIYNLRKRRILLRENN
ncbi:prolipoprotein diacylglyceryl transferase [candidate division WWE3 bacterium]|nr:prolipoprotein diacylglyceryl transferase [candidate division WWE3 bacterium]